MQNHLLLPSLQAFPLAATKLSRHEKLLQVLEIKIVWILMYILQLHSPTVPQRLCSLVVLFSGIFLPLGILAAPRCRRCYMRMCDGLFEKVSAAGFCIFSFSLFLSLSFSLCPPPFTSHDLRRLTASPKSESWNRWNMNGSLVYEKGLAGGSGVWELGREGEGGINCKLSMTTSFEQPPPSHPYSPWLPPFLTK